MLTGVSSVDTNSDVEANTNSRGIEMASYNDIAEVLNATLSPSIMAMVINTLLSSQDDNRLTDEQADIAMTMFDALVDAVPQSTIELALSE